MKTPYITNKLDKILRNLGINSVLLSDMDYLDIDKESEKYITYTPSNKVNDDDMWDKNRVKIKIGRFFSHILILEPHEIENLVNQYKTLYYMINGMVDKIFEVVEGNDIFKYYQREYCVLGGGSLSGSCMLGADKNKLSLYTKNKKVVKLLVIKEGDKIKGRALMWETTDGIYIDRPYCRYDKDIYLYKMYAELNDYKFFNTHRNIKMEVKLNVMPRTLPYLDTFRNKKDKKILSSINNGGLMY